MKKRVLAVLLAAAMTLSLAACGSKTTSTSTAPAASTSKTSTEASTEVKADEPDANGMLNGKFVETRHISVEVFDRDGKTPAADNVWTQWIQQQMLDLYNVEVEFVAVPRWTETDQINNLLAAGTAPDICYTYSYPTIQTYADMGGVIDLVPYLEANRDMLPNLFEWLGDELVYWDLNPVENTLIAIEGRRNNTYRINTFVRQDWLDKLNMKAPTTTAEFEAMLVAFRDNAELLLGADASKMIPYCVTNDPGWTAAPVLESFMDPAITDREYYVNGFDDRKFTENGVKEGTRLLNKWYNDGLLWKDFALAADGTASDDLCKAGFVGAFSHNYDYPFRNAENSFNAVLAETYGPEAKFVAINCFTDKNGKYTHYAYTAPDRKVFFPATNDEPVASLLYVDFISSQATIEYLQTGEEGINHEVKDGGAIAIIAATDEAYTQNSGQNIDLTMTCNGLRLATEDLTMKSLAYTYSNVDPADVATAMKVAAQDAVTNKNVSVGKIEAESEGTDLTGKRDITWANSITCSVADFDAVWDKGMAEYLSAGGQAIIDERAAAWVATYGDVDMLP